MLVLPFRRLFSALLAVALMVTGLVVGASVAPAYADLGDAGGLTLNKTVDGAEAVTVGPGDSFDYDIAVGCDDNPCINAFLEDELPGQFAGFELSAISVFPSNPDNFDLALTGGCAVGAPLVAGCSIEIDFLDPLGSIAGVPQFGITDGKTFRVSYSFTVPTSLVPTWAYNGVAVPNTAEISADNATTVVDVANVTVEVPIVVDTVVTKTWLPDTQQFSPGAASTISTGIRNTSNMPATSLALQDPATAVDGAAALDTGSPFAIVDFSALCSPDSVTFPEGADLVQVDAYYFDAVSDTWSWITGTPAASAALPAGATVPANVGGLRATFTSSSGDTIVANGTAGALCFTVAQRSTHRTTGADLLTGASANNLVRGTVVVPTEDPVSKTAPATLTVTGLDVLITPGKQITPATIPAGGEATVSISGRNDSNGTLDSLTLIEPGAGSFLSDDLVFAGFTGTHTWPTGATGAVLTWHFSNSTSSIAPALGPADPLPATPTPPAGAHITGFTISYTGAIIVGTTAGLSFTVSSAHDMIDEEDVSEVFGNTVSVVGVNAAGSNTKTASAPLEVFYPEISLDLEKQLAPTAFVAPGGTVVATLTATTSSASQYVDPTRIVVEDRMLPRGAGENADFWDAHRLRGILFTDVPAGSTMTIQYTISTSEPPVWVSYEAAIPEGLYSTEFVSPALPVSLDQVTGLRFTFDNPSGFSQVGSVQPHLVFEAASTLRDNVTPTDLPDGATATEYENTATAQASGTAGPLTVESDIAEADDEVGVLVLSDSGDGPGTGEILVDKEWRRANGQADPPGIHSQSGSSLRTLQHWGITTPGYGSLTLTDAANPEAGPAGTVYQAFNLTRIRPITFTDDPLLTWDTVTEVALYNATDGWQVIAPPAGSWMNSTGFKGLQLSTAQQASTTGIRIVIVENTAVRTASTDPTRPAPGSGVASGIQERPIWFDWTLRNVLRAPGGAGDTFVTAQRGYNVEAGIEPSACGLLECGVVRNTFGVTAVPFVGDPATRTDHDDINLIDTLPAVAASKTVAPALVTAPHPGDVDPANYPTATFTIEAWNTATARASYLRSADPVPCTVNLDCITPASNHSPDIFTGQSYNPATNPFERFTLTGIAFTVPSAVPVSQSASQVAIWKRASDGTLSVATMNMTAAAALSPAALVDVIGVSVVYQSADPTTTGGLLPTQNTSVNHLAMTLTTQLRSTLRSDPDTFVAGGITVNNNTIAQSFDPVLAPSGTGSTPAGFATDDIAVSDAALDVTASKTITPNTILETNPSVPLTVTLGATDGVSTLAAEQVVITDVDADFWAMFELTGLSSTTRPAGAARVRVDVQLNGLPAWIAGTSGATTALPAVDLDEVTGIRFVYDNADGSAFSSTVPSADWAASAVFTVVLRAGQPFPATVENTVTATAWHDDYPEVDEADVDVVLLSTGTPQLDVQKEPLTGNATHIVEPGTPIDWTLRFTNTGTSYLDVLNIIDDLGTHLEWTGAAPSFATSTGGTLPTTGITVSQPTPSTVRFLWDDDARMQPGEAFTITIELVLLPGLTGSQTAVNEFTVTTEQTLLACTNVSGNAQGILDGLGATQCGTSNFVRPQSGALLFAQKSVQGEVDGTLVSGATNVTNPAQACVPDAQGFFRGVCAAHTVIGATDTWRLHVVNSGTVGYDEIVVVDVLPRPGDRMLATGSARGSDFRPVLVDVTAPSFVNVPSGATVIWEVSTDPLACVGSGATSAWGADPICSTTTWVLGSAYTGEAEDVTAVRWSVDFTTTTAGMLLPGGEAEIRFDTVNTPEATSESPGITVPVGPQHAWNQFGVTATTTANQEIRRAPTRTGVLTQIAELELAKVVDGDAADFAPDVFTVDLACTIAGEPVVMGALATVDVPRDDSVTVGELPLGAECEITGEPVSGGAHTIDLGDAVTLDSPTTPPVITVTNTFDAGSLSILKNRVGPGVVQYGAGPFELQVTCTWERDGTVTALPLPDGDTYLLSAASGYRVDLPILPLDAWCEIVETDAGAATSVEMDPVDGRVQIVEADLLTPPATVTITNHFNQIAYTGVDQTAVLGGIGAGLLLLLGGGSLLLVHRARRRH